MWPRAATRLAPQDWARGGRPPPVGEVDRLQTARPALDAWGGDTLTCRQRCTDRRECRRGRRAKWSSRGKLAVTPGRSAGRRAILFVAGGRRAGSPRAAASVAGRRGRRRDLLRRGALPV